ncbi:MAG: hypothetical protein WCP55_10120 [Lentisphaerota bacterium]
MPTAGWSAQDITDLFTKIDGLQSTLNTVSSKLDTINTSVQGVISWVGAVNTSVGTTNTSLASIQTEFEAVVGATADVDGIRGHTVPPQTGNDPRQGKILNLLRHLDNYHDDATIAATTQGNRFKTPSFSQPIMEAPGKEDLDGNGKIYLKDFLFKNDDELTPGEQPANLGLKPNMFVVAEQGIDRTSITKITYSSYKAWVNDTTGTVPSPI